MNGFVMSRAAEEARFVAIAIATATRGDVTNTAAPRRATRECVRDRDLQSRAGRPRHSAARAGQGQQCRSSVKSYHG